MILEEVVKENCESSSGYMTRQNNHTVLQKIGSAIETYRNSSQELWVGLRDFAVTNCVRCQLGLLQEVEDFCFAVFDCLEPNVPREEREQRMIHVGALAVPLNLRIADAGRQLTASDNAFLVKWNIVAGTSMVAVRQPNPDVGLILAPLPLLILNFDRWTILNPFLRFGCIRFTLPSTHRHLVQSLQVFWALRRWAWAWRFGKRKKWYNMTVNLSARDS